MCFIEPHQYRCQCVVQVLQSPTSHSADYYICALPFERVPALIPELDFDINNWEHSPITGIHLWFDRPVTSLPHATLLDRTIQWMFNKSEGRYMQLVVSASRSLIDMPAAQTSSLSPLRNSPIFSPRARSSSGKGARGERGTRDLFSQPRHGTAAPAAATGLQPLSRRRLDSFRLARHHGRRSSQRLCRGRRDCASFGDACPVPPSRCCIIAS